jgi:hypothetical protein
MDAFSANSDASDASLMMLLLVFLVHEIWVLGLFWVENVVGEIVKNIGMCSILRAIDN